METFVRDIAAFVSGACELASIVILALGAATAAVTALANWRRYETLTFKKEVWLRFAASIMLALEFALAADIVDTAVAPSWEAIGQLAAIAAIRTFLNLFLERDLETSRMRLSERSQPGGV